MVLKEYRKHDEHERKQRMSSLAPISSPVDPGDDTHSWAHSCFLFSILARACSAFSATLRSLSTCRFPSFTPAGLAFGWRNTSSSGGYTQVSGHTSLAGETNIQTLSYLLICCCHLQVRLWIFCALVQQLHHCQVCSDV